MNDTLLYLSSTMSNNHERIHEIKYHINQLLSELRLLESNNNNYLENLQPFNITINSSLTTISNENYLLDNQCPYLSHKKPILHSTTYHKYNKIYHKKKYLKISPKKNLFSTPTCITSTPKNSPNQNILLKPHLTSTPRHNKRQLTNDIPLKYILYNNKNKNTNRQKYSTKRLIHPRYSSLNPIDENPQWI